MVTNNQLRKKIKELCIKHNIPDNYRGIFLRIVVSQESIDDIGPEKGWTAKERDKILVMFSTAVGSKQKDCPLRPAVMKLCEADPMIQFYPDAFIEAVAFRHSLDKKDKEVFVSFNKHRLDPEILRDKEAKIMMKEFKKTDVHSFMHLLKQLFVVWQTNGFLDPLPVYEKRLPVESPFSWGKKRVNRSLIDAQKAILHDPLFRRDDEDPLEAAYSSGMAYV